MTFPSSYPFKNAPMKHQLKALDKFFGMNVAAIGFEQGLGKTFTAINLVTAWYMTGKIDAVLVLCPSSIKLVWEKELDEHCPLSPDVHVLKTGKYKAADAFITGKHEFPWVVVGIEGLSQGQAFDKAMKYTQLRRTAVIIDESSKIKNDSATRTKKAIRIGWEAKCRIILSGTMISQGLEDLYSQFRFLDPNIIGHTSFYSFRNSFCITKSIEVSRDRWVHKIVGYQNEKILTGLIAPYSVRVEKKDALDLPEKLPPQMRFVEMSKQQAKIYKEMKDELIAYVENSEYEVTTVLEKILRLQQITGGYYPFEDGTPVPIPGPNPKLKELVSLLEEVSGKVIIWCQFRKHVEDVVEAIGEGVVQFHGGMNDDEKKESVRRFMSSNSARYMVATRAAAYGLTLTAASTAVYYSQGYSLEDYSQSQDRIHRIGQKDICTYIHLVCEGTIDVDIMKALANKQAVADMVYGMMKK